MVAGQVGDAVVPVKSAWYSKINWVQAGGIAAAVAAYYGAPDDVKAAVTTSITAIVTIVTWIIRTWFTTSVTPSSIK